MELKFILIAVGAIILTVKVFAGAKTLPAIVGFCGIFCMLLLAVNCIIAKLN